VFFYGHASPNQTEIYKQLIDRLAAVITKRLEVSADSRHSGLIINSCGWIEGTGYDLILYLAEKFNVNVILVLGHARLANDLKEDQRLNPTCIVTKLPRSEGVVSRTGAMRGNSRLKNIKEYFYGPANDLCPHQKVINWKDLNIYRIGGTVAAPSSALPIGATRLVDPNALLKVVPTLELQNSVMAVSFATDSASLLQHNVAGFVYVSQVDTQKRNLTLLCPSPGPLPSTFFLTGSIKWHD